MKVHIMDDRISTLPDEILSHILSFLQTEQAVATSVLSKRWKPLWLSLTSLSLVCPPAANDFNVPRSIFSCRALVVLKLDGLTFKSSNYSFEFPLLKSLQLTLVVFYKYQCFVELLNSCPILEDLKADIAYFGSSSIDCGSISLPKLVRADIYLPYDSDHYTPFKALSNVEFLRVKQFMDTDPNLIPVFSNLTRLEIVICTGHASWCFVFDMLKNCPKLQNLLVDHPAEFLWEVWCPPDVVPECLSFELIKCTLKSYRGEECQKQFAQYIMQNSSFLQDLTIYSLESSKFAYLGSMETRRMVDELSMCLKRSPTCAVSFNQKLICL